MNAAQNDNTCFFCFVGSCNIGMYYVLAVPYLDNYISALKAKTLKTMGIGLLASFRSLRIEFDCRKNYPIRYFINFEMESISRNLNANA